MTLEKHIVSRLSALGINCSIVNDEIHIARTPRPVKIKIDDEWREAFALYKRARSITFDIDSRTLVHNNSVEVLVTRLAPAPVTAESYTLTDRQGNTVCIGSGSHTFAFSFFDSTAYEEFFRTRIRHRLLVTEIYNRRVFLLFWMPTTAVYVHKGRKTPTDLQDRATAAIKRSLFKIAVEQHDCLSLWKSRKRRLKSIYLEDTACDDQTIPQATYDENVTSYYKVAKASPFPSQSFLAYYHVLEYYFLRVSELLLHDRLSSMLNNPGFSVSKQALDKVISTVRGQDARADETEMLRNVLERFVPESDLIEFIQKFEAACGESIYSKKRTVFGEQLQISPMKDHALANSAKVLKYIRNAIVHSSDRYKREDCHIPLSDSEGVIEEFIPLARFFAERVIFGTAT